MINRNLERALLITKEAIEDARSKILLGSTQKENITLPQVYYNALEMGVKGDEHGTGESGIRVLMRQRENDILAINPTLDPRFVRYDATIWVSSKFSLGNCSELAFRFFDYILNNTDKEAVKMELDLAWATKAKQDPVELFKLHPGRYPLWHVKDLDKTTMNPAEVGSGIVDFKHVFDNAKLSGMKYFFVEQDGAPQPLQNVTNSYNYLKKMQG